MFRFLGLLAATAALSAVVSATSCHDKAEALRNCVMTIPEPDYETETGQMAFRAAMQGCCGVSLTYTSACGEESAFLHTWRSWNTTMSEQQWNTAAQLLATCPRDSVPDCVGKLTSVATCVRDSPDCCTPAMHSGRCFGYELESLWDQVDPIHGLDRTSLEGPVGEVFANCPSYTDFDCSTAIDTLLETIDGLPEDAEYPRDVSHRCTAASTVSHICRGQGDHISLRLSTASESTRDHFYKQLDACDVTRDEDDGPPGECGELGELIPGAYLYHEGAITYLAMESCPPATDPTTSLPGVLCEPVYGPVSTAPMFYKVGYFNAATMMETPPDCLPPVDPMP